MLRNSENDKFEYYYYLSDKQSESNIQDWVKINENQTDINNITFKLNTKDVTHFDELYSSTVLYIYVKEVAIKGGDQKVLTSDALEIEPNSEELEIYLDDVKIELDYDDSDDDDNKENDDKNIVTNNLFTV